MTPSAGWRSTVERGYGHVRRNAVVRRLARPAIERRVDRLRLVSAEPFPLVSEDLGLALFASPKAGFTFASKWFFHHLGLLDDALAYHRFVHTYRVEVYLESPDASQSLVAFSRRPRRFLVVKVVRDPYDRAVSSYIHANRTGYDDAAIQRFVGRTWDGPAGRAFSFREFVDYLSSLDLKTCNPHNAVQTHPAERAGLVTADHVVRLDEIHLRLPDVETRLGLEPADLSPFRSSPHHTDRTASVSEFAGDEVWNFRGKHVPAPPSHAFYDEALGEQIAELYREDFERYGFPRTLP